VNKLYPGSFGHIREDDPVWSSEVNIHRPDAQEPEEKYSPEVSCLSAHYRILPSNDKWQMANGK